MKEQNCAIVVTGARCVVDTDVPDSSEFVTWYEVVEDALKRFEGPTNPGNFTLLHGDCFCNYAGFDRRYSIDQLAAEWVINHAVQNGRTEGITVIPVPANWTEQNKSAGPIRNTAMIRMLEAYRSMEWRTAVVGIHPSLEESKGTLNCMNKARYQGFEVWYHNGVSLECWDG